MAPAAEAKKLPPAGNVSAALSRAHNTPHAELPVGFRTPDKPPERGAATERRPPFCHLSIPLLLGTFFFPLFFRISVFSVTLPEELDRHRRPYRPRPTRLAVGAGGPQQLPRHRNLKLHPGRDLASESGAASLSFKVTVPLQEKIINRDSIC